MDKIVKIQVRVLGVTERFKVYHKKAVQSVPPLGIVLMGFLLIWVKGLRF